MATDIRVDTAPLAGAFRDMTASYKAFWFLALVDAAASQPGSTANDRLAPFEEMRERMLRAAFWPAVRSRKGLRLPADELVDKMCGMHLAAVRHAMDDPGFIRTAIAESYETDLRIDLRRASNDEFLAA